MQPVYKRVLLKLSGEGLMGDKAFGMSAEVIASLAKQIKRVHECGVELCIVVGGGNIFRGAKEASAGMNRSVADQVGMLATIMNALYLQNALEQLDVSVRVMSGLNVPQVCEPYMYRKALKHLSCGRVVIFAGGTGNPYFTTDTGAALRAAEMQCDVMLKATQVDGVYDSDPLKNPTAARFDRLTYDEVIEKQLKVMDSTAVMLARESSIPIVVFAQKSENALENVLCGQGKFTIIQKERGQNV
jgi:uridylate kinase